MKLLKVIKLHNLEEKNLLMNELSTLKGGATCGCHGSASTNMISANSLSFEVKSTE